MIEDPLQQLQNILQQKAGQGEVVQGGGPISIPQPVDAVDAHTLPAETPWKWDEVCRLVGSLYLESHHRYSSLETHAKSITRQLDEQRRVLVKENEAMQKDIDRLESELQARDTMIEDLREELDARPGQGD